MQIGVAHFRSLGLLIFFVLLALERADDAWASRTGATMEANIPSELDRTYHNRSSRSSTEYTTELEDGLVNTVNRVSSREGELVATVLQVLGVSIVKRGDLTLGIAVFLHRIGHVVVLSREDSRIRDPGSKPTSKISCRKCLTGIQGHFGFHTDNLVPGIQKLEGLEFGLGA